MDGFEPASILKQLPLLAGHVAQCRISGAPAIHSTADFALIRGTVRPVRRIQHGEVNQLPAYVFNPNIFIDDIIDSGRITVVNTDRGATLHMNHIDVLESNRVDRVRSRFKPDLDGVPAVGHIPED